MALSSSLRGLASRVMPGLSAPRVSRTAGGGISVSVDQASLRRVLNNIDNMNKKAIREFKRGLADEGREALKKAKDYCPVDTGRLRDSGERKPHRGVHKDKDNGYYTTLNFGGKKVRGVDVDYAAYVHEGFTHWRSGHFIKGRKFLERAVREVWRGAPRRIARRVKLATGAT